MRIRSNRKKNINDRDGRLSIRLRSPSGEEYLLENGVPFSVQDPQLWWPNGLGEQPLYQVEAIFRDTAEIDAGNVEPVSDQAAERIVRMISMIFVTRKGL